MNIKSGVFSLFIIAGLVAFSPAGFTAQKHVNNWTAQFAVTEFMADFVHYRIGDKAPDIFQTPPYIIDNWQARNLPVPEANSHWTYMGETYVLITNTEGKILRAFRNDIFYPHH